MGSPSNRERLRAMHLENCVCAVDGQMQALKSALSAAGIEDAGALQSVQQEFPSICAGWQHTEIGESVFSSSMCLTVADMELAGQQSAENISIF